MRYFTPSPPPHPPLVAVITPTARSPIATSPILFLPFVFSHPSVAPLPSPRGSSCHRFSFVSLMAAALFKAGIPAWPLNIHGHAVAPRREHRGLWGGVGGGFPMGKWRKLVHQQAI